jgi:hypothetical protein
MKIMANPQYYALWDVDENLTISHRGATCLNQPLLDAYKAMGITRGMFFTSYDCAALHALSHADSGAKFPKPDELLSLRCSLNKKMQAQGFQVDAVATCRDYWYEKHLRKTITMDGIAKPDVASQAVYKPGRYYTDIIEPLEKLYCSLTANEREHLTLKERFRNNGKIIDAIAPEIELNQKINSEYDPTYFSEAVVHEGNPKYHLFRLLVASYGGGNLEVGAQVIKKQNIVFVYSDDGPHYIRAVTRAATGVQLEKHLIIISTERKGRQSLLDSHINFLDYLQAIYKPDIQTVLPDVVSNIIDRQQHLPVRVTTQNQLEQARSLNYRAFKRIAEKCLDRRSRHYSWRDRFSVYWSKTLRTELGEKKSRTLCLEFLKLAWLFRSDPMGYNRAIHEHLYQEIAAIKRLNEIYIINKNRYSRQKPENQFGGLDYDNDAYKGFIKEKFQGDNSPWWPLLTLSRNIDNFILNGKDRVALFRLVLFYATLDASNTAFDPAITCSCVDSAVEPSAASPAFFGFHTGHHKTLLETGFEKLIGLEREKNNHNAVTVLTQLKTEILLRRQASKPSFSWLSPRLHRVYARYGLVENTQAPRRLENTQTSRILENTQAPIMMDSISYMSGYSMNDEPDAMGYSSVPINQSNAARPFDDFNPTVLSEEEYV